MLLVWRIAITSHQCRLETPASLLTFAFAFADFSTHVCSAKVKRTRKVSGQDVDLLLLFCGARHCRRCFLPTMREFGQAPNGRSLHRIVPASALDGKITVIETGTINVVITHPHSHIAISYHSKGFAHAMVVASSMPSGRQMHILRPPFLHRVPSDRFMHSRLRYSGLSRALPPSYCKPFGALSAAVT